MKIVYFIESFDQKAGIERVTAAKANFFAETMGYDVTIISAYSQDAEDSYELSPQVHRKCLGLKYVDDSRNFIIKNVQRLKVFIEAIVKFNKYVRDIEPDVIVYTWVLGAILLPVTMRKALKVYESHTPLHRIPFSFFQRFSAKCADKVVCLTNGDAKEYERYTKNVIVIPNFVDNRGEKCPDYAVHKAIAVGRLSEEKGFDILLSAWKIAVEKNPDWILEIFGEGEKRSDLEEQIRSLKIGNSVVLRGNVENVMSQYATSSLQIMTSRYEGLPMTLIEGQTCGLPCVCTNFRYGASDVIENGQNGIIVDVDDVEALASSMIQLMSNEQLRQKMGMNAQKRAKDYSSEVILNRWMQLFSSAK
ncbi:MAG: glycosyltransferase family 4 protein [Bacteroidales bacterium]|nr:glycosyltransferase family 4 protein [Bacteroidales bacterium]